MKTLLKLTDTNGENILIGVDSIISVEKVTNTDIKGNKKICTKIFSRAAMAVSYYVIESVEEIYLQYNS